MSYEYETLTDGCGIGYPVIEGIDRSEQSIKEGAAGFGDQDG